MHSRRFFCKPFFKMWGNAFFIAKIQQCRGDAVVIPSHGREMGQALFRSFVFVLKKRFLSGGSAGDPPARSPHPLDTLFREKI